MARRLSRSALRYALAYVFLFALSVTGVVAYFYVNTVVVVGQQTDATIEAEITGLADQYRQFGLVGLIRTIQQRTSGETRRRNIYLLTGPRSVRLAGNLSAWPDSEPDEQGWIDFLIDDPTDEAGPITARARTFDLLAGRRLLVGRDTTEHDAVRRLAAEALAGALALTGVLGAVGGLFMGRYLLRRIEAINRSSRAILDGDMSRRMPVGGRGDEFDDLAANLNAMLDRIDHLMTGMRQVSNDIAHDLRGPISRLRSRLEITLMAERDTDTYRRAIADTIDEADGLLATFNALLSIALAESGALRDRFVPVDLAMLARDVVELYEPAAADKGIKMALSAEGATVAGNRDLLTQALANLLDNAVKYTPAGGTITVTVTGDPQPQLAVADTGPGIPPDQRAKALERFGRLDASRSAPGAGLGLSLAQAVAQLHGAALSLDENYPGLRATLAFRATTG